MLADRIVIRPTSGRVQLVGAERREWCSPSVASSLAVLSATTLSALKVGRMVRAQSAESPQDYRNGPHLSNARQRLFALVRRPVALA